MGGIEERGHLTCLVAREVNPTKSKQAKETRQSCKQICTQRPNRGIAPLACHVIVFIFNIFIQ
jgi:hypothetical protein